MYGFYVTNKSILSQSNVCARLINYAIKSTRAYVLVDFQTPYACAYTLYIMIIWISLHPPPSTASPEIAVEA